MQTYRVTKRIVSYETYEIKARSPQDAEGRALGVGWQIGETKWGENETTKILRVEPDGSTTEVSVHDDTDE